MLSLCLLYKGVFQVVVWSVSTWVTAHLHLFVRALYASLRHTHTPNPFLRPRLPPPPSPSVFMSSVKTGGWIRFDKFCSVWPRVRTGSTIQLRKTMSFTPLPPRCSDSFFILFVWLEAFCSS